MSHLFKFQHLRPYGSVESLFLNFKKYRRVFDELECTYLYVELAFFNKKFDEEDWTTAVRLVCTKEDDGTKICEHNKTYTIAKDTNIYYVREGWGTPKSGWWKKGKYRWDAYIGDVLLGTCHFHIQNLGLVTATENPYLTLQSVKLFETGTAAVAKADRVYCKTFEQKTTRYINVELAIEWANATRPMPFEFIFNFYNDAGQYKATTTYFWEYTHAANVCTFDTGYGMATPANFWYEDNYTMEIVFMDTLIGVVPFSVAAEAETHEGSLPFFTTRSTPTDGSGMVRPVEKKKLTFEEATAELKKLIGLESVKQQLDEFSTYLQFLQVRKKKGFTETNKFNMHAVFMGNPGTGKTTVANMIGQIYNSLDLLSKGHVVEVGRVDLVGEYIGQTAPKVQKAIEKARGGILFIDEAYALTSRAQGADNKDFGPEVIEVLLKEMSDGQGDIAMIFAGYPKEMNQFMATNPGMTSRISSVITFPDYTPDEMMEIAQYVADKKDVIISEEAKKFIHRRIVEEYRNRNEHFGNARYVNGIVEECKENMALRLMRSGQNLEDMSADELSTIALPDAERAFGVNNAQNVAIPVDQMLLDESLAELHALIGIDDIKHQVDEMVKLVRYYTEIGRDVKKAFSIHTVFTGNPGTGKTTVARILVKIYKALGVLERGHLVECDRKNLVGTFIGETAVKTGNLIASAKGGGLFIDEAYALNTGGNDTFGKEAINTLLKEMEDKRGEFMVIVAGYVDEMRLFLESNPGLMSRFDKTINFTDYTEEQLLEIARTMFISETLYLDAEATQVLRQYVQQLLINKHKYFGNARTMRKLVKEIARRQNLRLAQLPNYERTPELIRTINVEDLQNIRLSEFEAGGTDSRKSIGF
jgi:SpoVK/Ycf46/Vps4 family AAA+-type ATPase